MRAKSVSVKDIIDALEVKYGSLRKAGEAMGVSHQTLSNWRAGKSKELTKVFDFLKSAQKVLKMSDSETYRTAAKK